MKSVGRSAINARAILGAIFHENGFKFIYWNIDFFYGPNLLLPCKVNAPECKQGVCSKAAYRRKLCSYALLKKIQSEPHAKTMKMGAGGNI